MTATTLDMQDPEQHDYFQIITVKSHLKLWDKGLRGSLPLKTLLSLANRFTGKTYTRYMVGDAILDLEELRKAILAARLTRIGRPELIQ